MAALKTSQPSKASLRIRAIAQLGKAGSTRLLNSFLHRGCAVCDRPTPKSFCTDCQRQLQDQIRHYSQAGASSDPCFVASLGAYDGVLKRAILSLKYENRPEVAQFLGAELGRQWLKAARSLPAKPLYALPIPLHSERQRQRGYNQAALLARSFCQVSGLTLLEHGLVRSQATVPQHQLGIEARQKNLEGAFALGKSLHRQQAKAPSLGVVLIDDIYTTGVTVRSAAEVLKRSDVSVLGTVVVARA